LSVGNRGKYIAFQGRHAFRCARCMRSFAIRVPAIAMFEDLCGRSHGLGLRLSDHTGLPPPPPRHAFAMHLPYCTCAFKWMVLNALISSWTGDRNIRILKMHISTPFSLHLVPAHFHCIATNALSFMPCNICFRVFVPCPWTLLAFWVVIPNTKVGGGQGSPAECGTKIFLEKSKVEKE
jgi:hypothetical protein